MASQIAPGVVVNEFDFSDYAERVSTAIFGVVGVANKGPINQVAGITNERQLIELFGTPMVAEDANLEATYGSRYYSRGLVAAALQYLRYGNQLRVVRVQNNSSPAVKAAVVINNATSNPRLTVTALYAGTWANTDLQVRVETGTTTANSLKISILYKTIVKEVYDNVLWRGSDAADENYIETRINNGSSLVRVDETTDSDTPPSNGTYTLTAGTDGTASIAASDFIGSFSAATGTATGMQLFRDVDSVDLNLMACPGVNTELGHATDLGLSVVREMATICEARRDCLGLVDPPLLAGTGAPFQMSARKAKDFINGSSPWSGGSVNTSFAAYYWPWVKVQDNYNSKEVWMPPSGIVAGIMAYSDSVSDPWFAPAGVTRGRLTRALDLQHLITGGENEEVAGPSQCVNPIKLLRPDGITIWGQKTTQRKATSLNRVNVRRMLSYAEKIVQASVRVLVFEPNDEFTWLRFVQLVQPVFDTIKARRGLEDFKVVCDASTNPPELRDRNEMRGIIALKPQKAAETITVDFVLTTSGASFSEFIPNG